VVDTPEFSIANKTKGKLSSLPFFDIKNAVVGKKYQVSLVFCGDKLSRKLNALYRGKDKPTNVLSFPLSENSGEIFINLRHLNNFSVGFLFIHGLLHLKGFEHGDTMEKREKMLARKFRV